MTRTMRHLATIVTVSIVVLFTHLGGPRLWDRDEPRNAGCAIEMMARGDWVTPIFDGELRTHKPILLYWFIMTAYGVFGVNEFAARFWSAVSGLGTVCLTYGVGRRLFSTEVGLWAAIILCTTLMFDVAARAATPDSLLIFWSTAAVYVYVRGTFPARDAAGCSSAPVRWFPRWPLAVVMYATMGMAALAKGPVGLVLPAAVIGMYLLVQRLAPFELPGPRGWNWVPQALVRMARPFEPRHFLRTCWLMRPLTALSVVLAVALPWYLLVALRTDGHWVRGFFLDHNLGRATQPLEGHSGSLLFYPLALLVGFFPWSVFAVPTLVETTGNLRRRAVHRAGYVLATCWVAVYVGLFSLAQTKLPSYITPCYPGVALLVAGFLVNWQRGESISGAYWLPAALACLGLSGLGISIATAWAASKYFPGEEWLALIGCLPALTALVAYGLLRRGRRERTALVLGMGAVVFVMAIFGPVAGRVAQHQKFDALIATAFHRARDPRIGTLGVLEPSWVFYTRRPLYHLFAPELAGNAAAPIMPGDPRAQGGHVKPFWNAWQFLHDSPDHFVITTESLLKQIPSLPGHVEVVARGPYFLRREELVLLARRSRVHEAFRAEERPADQVRICRSEEEVRAGFADGDVVVSPDGR